MYPLGNFDPNAPVNPQILSKSQAFFKSLPVLAAGSIWRCYLHWTVSSMCMDYTDYNAEAKLENGLWVLKLENSPANNVPGHVPYAAHTYRRNSGAVGIALTGMDGDGVDEHNFGPDPVTVMGLTHLCAGAAALCRRYGINPLGMNSLAPYAWEPSVLTHAEAADRPGEPPQYAAYGPGSTMERWDLMTLTPLPSGVHPSSELATQSGDALRKLIATYWRAL